MQELWTEKYRQDTVENYVFRDQAQKEQVQGWIKGKTIPHLLFSGAPGIGKTTLAKILINELILEYIFDAYVILLFGHSRSSLDSKLH